MLKSVPCYLMRGGTSKGLFFLKEDLPEDSAARDALLLKLMGSPDERQIDGLGGAHPLTSKVAIVSRSTRENTDVDYLFLQVTVDKALVSDAQNCGNILAGVGPFAIEKGLVNVDPSQNHKDVRIHMVNTGSDAVSRVQLSNGKVNYQGEAAIDGVPLTSAPVLINFLDIAGSSCGALFPTGNAVDTILETEVTCIDNGMPVVLLNAQDFGLTGTESPSELEGNTPLCERIESIRLQAGQLMNLGDVAKKTVPKMSLVSKPSAGGLINTRTFIPHRVHDAIGVLGSVSVATACVLQGTVASKLLQQSFDDGSIVVDVEHPTGQFSVEMDIANSASLSEFVVHRAALLRTARLLMRGEAFADCE
ncbi:4-oxalomesaconate tautomerase [Alteromonas mediterranea]|uniref:4-oxalomesaconate tautomerase n=1 Tax=Alteromonas mediterranea TaxID=314275 RepID=A0AAC9JBC0_9ALTE|nr:4-oxalomesaconate tautomerase [Alteromonas mediterranea]APD88393.1 4-oxalomesaconate tautomerase [Alteromonas mediterranea]